MNIITTQIKDVVIIEPDIFEDNRGFLQRPTTRRDMNNMALNVFLFRTIFPFQ